MSKNVKVQTFFDIETYVKILEHKKKNALKTDSTAIYSICKRYFNKNSELDNITKNFDKIIQGQHNKILNLEYELKQAKEKKVGKEKKTEDKNDKKK